MNSSAPASRRTSMSCQCIKSIPRQSRKTPTSLQDSRSSFEVLTTSPITLSPSLSLTHPLSHPGDHRRGGKGPREGSLGTSLSLHHPHPHSLSLSLSPTHTHSLPHTLTHTHTHTHTLSLSLSHPSRRHPARTSRPDRARAAWARPH